MNVAAVNGKFAHDLIVGLVRLGVAHAVVAPGSRSTPLVLALAARKDIACHVAIDERGAGFMALGLARGSARPVALVCTSGSAVAHTLPAVQEAAATGACVVLLSADRPAALHGVGANQTIQQAGIARAYTRIDVDMPAPDELLPDDLRACMDTALQSLRAAWAERPGPVQINVRFREPLWLPGGDGETGAPAAVPEASAPVNPSATPAVPAGPTPQSAALLAACAGRRGLLVAGPTRSGVALRDTALNAAVRAAARALGWPVLADVLSGLRDEGDVGLAGDLLARADALAAWPPEVVVRIGRGLTSRCLEQTMGAYACGRVWQVDPWGDVVDPECATAPRTVRADPIAVLAAMSRQAPAPVGWLAWWQAADKAVRGAAAATLRCDDWEGALATGVAARLRAGELLHIGNSMPVRDLDAFAATVACTVCANRGVSGIDGGIATLVGEALALRAPRAVGLLGDVALQHDVGSMALLAAARREADIKVVAVCNGGGSIFGFLPIAAHATAFERFFLTPQAFDPVAAAAAFGLRGVTVPDAAAAGAALADPETAVVAVIVDRAVNLERHRTVWRDLALPLASEQMQQGVCDAVG